MFNQKDLQIWFDRGLSMSDFISSLPDASSEPIKILKSYIDQHVIVSKDCGNILSGLGCHLEYIYQIYLISLEPEFIKYYINQLFPHYAVKPKLQQLVIQKIFQFYERNSGINIKTAVYILLKHFQQLGLLPCELLSDLKIAGKLSNDTIFYSVPEQSNPMWNVIDLIFMAQ